MSEVAINETATDFANLLEDKKVLNSTVERLESEIESLKETNNDLNAEMESRDKDIEEYRKLMASYALGTGESDALEFLKKAREFHLQKYIISEFGVDNEKSRSTKTFEDKQSELENRTDTFAILTEALEYDPQSFWREQCEEQKALTEKLDAQLEEMRKTHMLISDHRAQMEEMKYELSNGMTEEEMHQALADAASSVQTGKLALKELRNRAIVALLRFSHSKEKKRHNVTPALENIKKTTDISVLLYRTDSWYDLAGVREASAKEQEKIILSDENLRRLYLIHKE